ncbi:MAG: helix-turn-helix domain-containing protein [Lactobacillus crispatus]
MDIGQALRKERLDLGLTQQQMCEGILSRPFYAKVESGQYRINAESLFEILFSHQVDVVEFLNLTQENYLSEELKAENQLTIKINQAVNTKNIKLLKLYCQQIVNTSNNEVLKLRASITLAYFMGELDKVDEETKTKIKAEFDEGRNWTSRPELLRLLANTMPLWSQDELDFLIGRLLTKAKKEEFSDLMMERYLRLMENYLVICYERKVQKKKIYSNHVNEVMNYIIEVTKPFHLMIYRIEVFYLKALFSGQKDEAKKIKQSLKKIGYEKEFASWPE